MITISVAKMSRPNKKDLLRRSFPKAPPEKMVGEYMQSKLEEAVVK